MARRTPLIILALLLLFYGGSAYALDGEYVVWGGFDGTVTAFRRVALMFNDNIYQTLFFSFIVLGLVLGIFFIVGKGFSGNQVNPIAVLLPPLAGVVLLRALVFPTGTVTIYDNLTNRFDQVPGVPDIIVATAGTLNLIERTAKDIVDATSAHPYDNSAGGITFELIYRAASPEFEQNDYYLEKTLGEYFYRCGGPALASNGNNIDLNELKRGSGGWTGDYMNALSEMTSNALYTTVWNPGNKNGVVMTCTDAYAYLDSNSGLNFNNAALYQDLEAKVCEPAHYDPTVPTALARCRERMVEAAAELGVNVNRHEVFLRNFYVAQAIYRTLGERFPDEATRMLANQQMVHQGVGMMQMANEWMPSIRTTLLNIILGALPFLALLIPTMMFGKALGYITGLFVWFTLWGIMDIMVHGSAWDNALNALSVIRDYDMALDAIYLARETSIQALGTFGTARSMSIMLATAISTALFKFGGYAFSAMAQQYAELAEKTGADAAQKTSTPQGRREASYGLVGAASEAEIQYRHGFAERTDHETLNASSGIEASNAELAVAASQGLGANAYAHTRGQVSGGTQAGQTTGRAAAAGHNTAEGLAGVSGWRAEREVTATAAERDKLGNYGIDAATAGEIDARVSAGNTAATDAIQRDLAARASEELGHPVTRDDIAASQSTERQIDAAARLAATGFSGERLANTAETRQEMETARLETIDRSLGGATHVGSQDGRRQIVEADAFALAANKFGMTGLTEDRLAGYESVHANRQAAEEVAGARGIDRFDQFLAESQANRAYAIGADDAAQLHAEGVFSDEQFQLARNGGVLTGTMQDGQLSNAQFFAGSTATLSQSSTADASDVYMGGYARGDEAMYLEYLQYGSDGRPGSGLTPEPQLLQMMQTDPGERQVMEGLSRASMQGAAARISEENMSRIEGNFNLGLGGKRLPVGGRVGSSQTEQSTFQVSADAVSMAVYDHINSNEFEKEARGAWREQGRAVDFDDFLEQRKLETARGIFGEISQSVIEDIRETAREDTGLYKRSEELTDAHIARADKEDANAIYDIGARNKTIERLSGENHWGDAPGPMHSEKPRFIWDE